MSKKSDFFDKVETETVFVRASRFIQINVTGFMQSNTARNYGFITLLKNGLKSH